ncbi:MutS-related protein [Lacticaseibacillus suibinensis]|uniref:MutS-related protein n=1 Tax=Lacticaseibacillus suibinensis TaxID=2486011 RepID=UPI000F76A7F8|nr:DNA mismatch repair protein MutS [Lacticaseibacillus suibinensis]
MDNTWWWLLGLVALLFGGMLLSAWRARQQLQTRLLMSWGQLPGRTRQDSEASLQEAYAAQRQLHPQGSTIDDLTWHDLNLMQVFQRVNLTESSVGAEALYAQMRGFDFGQPATDEQLIAFFAQNQPARMAVRTAFAHLGKVDHNQSQQYLLNADHHVLPGSWQFRVLGLLPLVGVALIFVLPLAGVLLIIASLLFNLVYYQLRRNALELELNAMRYLVQTIAAAHQLSGINTPRQAALKAAYAPLKQITRHAFVFRTHTGTELEVVMDYLGICFMLPFIAYNSVLQTLTAQRQAALTLWQELGQLEVAIAIANFRQASPVVCQPSFQADAVEAQGLVHPLLKKPVANDLDWRQTALITGSNASGKSTYVKSVAINCVLAQTINTATASSFALAPGHVVTAMAVQDDITAGDSYFIAEIKAIQRVLKLAAQGQRVYGFIDEILKGTNTIERIAASASVVQWLSRTKARVMVATHDSELTEILKALVINWHFQETVTASGVTFDYQLHQGPATSHNAIALLSTMAYPQPIIQTAHDLVAAFEQTRSWPQVEQAE